jgi:hypothetical protein
MGGLLSSADGLYHDLGIGLAEQGIATVRVGWQPGRSPSATTPVEPWPW